MNIRNSRLFIVALAIVLASPLGIPALGRANAAAQVGPSGLPLPRFVSLKPGRVNLRVGPGRDYAVTWLFLKSGLPVEIVQEYDNWRRIRDSEGTEGWVYQSLLSGKRTAMTAPWQRDKNGAMLNVYRSPDDTASVVAKVQPGVLGSLKTCNGSYCRVVFSGASGWIRQSDIWGAYPDEKFDN
ncbi:SH3 domain-containing protein [Phyllobacterium endophyticum]|uniref:SH3 domain-containing protein n=1 Tax=Phyllobacterium endophyticum TaxID=1149773 RepID=UPI0018317F8C|nr:SH3 domain-containing protein [Phyllobacterium endophyticum]MBB3235371.1 SH3-like domain-containing protein [Phyllobacterium endophyticum]